MAVRKNKWRSGFLLLVLQGLLLPAVAQQQGTTLLYRAVFTEKTNFPDLQLNNVACRLTDKGLVVTGKDSVIQLNKYYSLGERLVRYEVVFTPDAVAVFRSNTGDYRLVINAKEQWASVTGESEFRRSVRIHPGNPYIIEIRKHYQESRAAITDLVTGEQQVLVIQSDGSGGVGVGAVQAQNTMAHQWDYYCFGLQQGTSLTVRQMTVQALECNLTLLLYGDSQSETEGYFPAKDFPDSWTQLVMRNIKGKAISSGRGGCTIKEVMERIRNELPYVKAKYVMVTIGTNGGNTEQLLSELVEYIRSQGSIPILNNVPANEHGSQQEINALIGKVRKKYNVKGCQFDLATSLQRDGKEVDKTTMWHEDYTAINNWGHYYHHPNVKGSRLMYLQTLLDIPEIYE
ncbi:SGNH/GDSL hydrolase family protein [Flavihumibacter petaseus]|uniref:SGNH hydrolase-type esterase domain-containing protein n=1 Tax=Flavihumibacter petaseus NBRC 106054 TaxID=1220578 RepID=A0A0E9N0D5_9BACT|nr:SGNH/GDSL hydrolase family protein [Flavihumibacter petaseus]GAO43091.1 hypothetical protein FPE01S_02_01950 [Flavihumibacter petaseus NBRC 106054]